MKVLPLCFALILSGCAESVVTSSKIAPSQPDTQTAEQAKHQCGSSDSSVIYSLPRAYVPVTLKFGQDVFQPTKEQNAQIGKLKNEITAHEAELKTASPANIVALQKLISGKKTEIATIKQAATRPGFKATVENALFYPDKTRTFALCYNRSESSDDDLEISVSSAGLLSKIAVKSDNRGDDVLRKIAEGAVEVAKLGSFGAAPIGAAPSAADRQVTDDDGCNVRDYEFRLLIDPTDETAAQKAIDEELFSRGVNTGCVKFKSETVAASSGKQPPQLNSVEAVKLCSQGACYRRAWPSVFTVRETSTASGSSFLTEIPNKGPLGVVSFQRGLFVLVEASAEFESGMLVGMKYSKPSEALAVASLPIDILKSIVSIPTVAFETQSGKLEAQATLLEAQAKLLAAERDLGPTSNARITELQNEISILKLQEEREELLGGGEAQ